MGRWLLAAVIVSGLWCAETVRAQAPHTTVARIVSTSPSITETLFAMGLGDRVVGVSTSCRFPAQVQALPKVGTFLRPSTEVIARLRPDLVVVHTGPNDVARQMSALGVRAVTVDQGSLASVFSSIRAIGDAAGAADQATALTSDLQRRLSKVRSDVSGRPRKRVLILVGRRPGTLADLVAVGRGSYLSDLVEIAGGVNVLNGDGLPEYPRISLETVIRLAPDVIIDAGDMGDTEDVREKKAALALVLWRGQPNVAALKAGAVHAVVSDAFVVPGPRVVEVAETFAEWIHGVKAP